MANRLKEKLDKDIWASNINIKNAFVEKESLKFGALKASKVTIAVATSHETQKRKELVKNDALNYVAVVWMLTVRCAIAQDVDVDWTMMKVYDKDGY